MAMTLRLTDEEEKALSNIKDTLGCTTLTATIKSLITLHSERFKNLDQITQVADKAIHERDAIKEEVANYLTAQNNLTKMVSPEWHDEVVKRLEAHEQGRSVTYSRSDVSERPPVSGLLSPLNYLKLSGANKVNNGLFHRTKRGNTQETIATC